MLIIYDVFVGLDLSHLIRNRCFDRKRLIQGRREGVMGGGDRVDNPPPHYFPFHFLSAQMSYTVRLTLGLTQHWPFRHP